MKNMSVIILLLSVLSIPKVWLKPTVVDSDFDNFYDDDDEDVRSKRQSLLFDLIHQAIEKYANCANEHLTPLKALVNSKQYETFVYPNGNEPSSYQILVGATNPNRNKPNIKCTKVDLCSVQNQHSHSIPSYNSYTPIILGKIQDPAVDISKEHRQYFPYNTKGFVRLPKYENSRYGSRKKPQNYSPEYFSQVLGKTNFTHLPFNREMFNGSLKNPKTTNKNMVEIIAVQDSKDPAPILDIDLRNTNPSSQNKGCICSDATTAKPITSDSLNSDFATTEEIILKSTETVPELILGASAPNNATTSETPKSCGCLEAKTPNPENTENSNSENSAEEAEEITIEPESVLASKHDNTLTLSSKTSEEKMGSFETKDSKWKQHLKLLFLKLDIKAHNESDDDLNRIMDKLKTLKSSIKMTDRHTNNKELNTFASTPKIKENTIATSAESATTQRETMVGDKVQANLSRDFSSAAAKIDLNHSKDQKINQINSKNIEHINNDSKSINFSIKPISTTNNTTTIIQTIHSSDKSRNSISHHSNALEDLSLNLNLNSDEDTVKAIQSSPALDLNITNSQDLRRITNEMQALVSTLTNKTTKHQNFEQKVNKPIDGTGVFVIQKTISSKNKETLSAAPRIKAQELHSKNHIKNFNFLGANLNANSPIKVPTNNKNDSSISSAFTIAVTSNGNFKNIQVEHQSSKSLDKNMEINEKENMNMGNSRSKVRSIDMTGTDSRYINFIKQPERKDPYSEPILSEIYPSKTEVKLEPPLSIYWHTIEEKPSKIKKNRKIKKMAPSPWKAFQSVDYDDNEKSNEENSPPLIKDCEDYEESEESEIEKHQNRFSKSSKLNSYLT